MSQYVVYITLNFCISGSKIILFGTLSFVINGIGNFATYLLQWSQCFLLAHIYIHPSDMTLTCIILETSSCLADVSLCTFCLMDATVRSRCSLCRMNSAWTSVSCAWLLKKSESWLYLWYRCCGQTTASYIQLCQTLAVHVLAVQLQTNDQQKGAGSLLSALHPFARWLVRRDVTADQMEWSCCHHHLVIMALFVEMGAHTLTASLSFLGSWSRPDALWRSNLMRVKRVSAAWFFLCTDLSSLRVAFSLPCSSANCSSRLVFIFCRFSSSASICQKWQM